MATFMSDLFTSIFTPGPTPTLLVATNISFAALQFILLVLLILTYSIHFIILSVLCGGLWWSINWFAAELEVAKRTEKKKTQNEAEQPHESMRRREENSAEDSGTETEAGEERAPAPQRRNVTRNTLQPGDAEMEVRKRRSLGSSTGDLSTDSEWDKVGDSDTQE